MNAKVITGESLPSVLELLKACKLPFQDVSLTDTVIVGYYNEEGQLIGSGGLEFYGDSALLRSVAVAGAERGKSLGQEIVKDIISRAKARSIEQIFLLTETAHDFFLRFGFRDTDRSGVPLEVQKSSEFSSVCPVSAFCMVLEL